MAQHELFTAQKIHKLMIKFDHFDQFSGLRSYQNICFYCSEFPKILSKSNLQEIMQALSRRHVRL